MARRPTREARRSAGSNKVVVRTPGPTPPSRRRTGKPPCARKPQSVGSHRRWTASSRDRQIARAGWRSPGKRTYVRLICQMWNFCQQGGRRSCTPISMPSTLRLSNCWILHCGTGPSPSAAVWCWRHRMKRGATASAAACQRGGPASFAVICFSSVATSAATSSSATMSCLSFMTSPLESNGCR